MYNTCDDSAFLCSPAPRPEEQQLRMPEMMLSWIGQLGHFLSFFPEKRDSFRGPTELEQIFFDRISEQRE